eukprot:CAMPEP_0183455378 /NCGR_PEP_ID=MMETSP0370-20130417/126499_1 /TAXON_ID=268820 /ORGANISM="Peridinium aciculiferum, Strain PAER-2" /LENGTH=45 /DNA_ID= /DNA_START= /DNA_END= /DNA_ORIENTATION=
MLVVGLPDRDGNKVAHRVEQQHPEEAQQAKATDRQAQLNLAGGAV